MKKNLLRQLSLALLLILTTGFQYALYGQVKVASVQVNKNVTFQKITGFGAFVNSPQFSYNHMTTAEIQQIWGAGSQTGCNIMRIYIPTGEANWAQVIPTAQLAKSLGLKIFATPWSMPSEWKTVNTIGSQYDSSGVKKEVYLKPEHYGDYARYLNNFVVLLRNNGVELDAISIQNEPDYKVDYAGCFWTPAQITTFLKENSQVISCPVMAPETVGMTDNYANSMLAPDVLPKFEIYGGHQYGFIGTGMKNLQAQGKELWMTEFLVNWNEIEKTTRNFDWAKDAFAFANSVNDALLANVNAWVHYTAKRFYGLMGDGQNGTTAGVITKRGRIFSQYAKYVTGSTRVKHTFTDNTGSLSGSAYLSATGDSVFVVLMNPSANTFSLAVELPFLSVAGKAIRTTATEDLTTTNLTFTETNRPTVPISPSSVTTLVFKKSGDFTPSQMISEVVNYKKIETQTPTSAAFGTAYMLSGKTATFSNGSRLISTNTTESNGYLSLDAFYNRLVFSVDTLTSAGSFTSANTTVNYINAAGAAKSYNYGTVTFNQRTNFDWALDISPNVLTDTCKGIISITNGNFSSILTFKFKDVFFATGNERGQSFSGTYSPYDGNLLDGFADTTYTSYNFTNVTSIPAQTDWYTSAVNKNAVFYTSAGTLANSTNVVSGTTSNHLALSDMGGDFYPPVSFTANSATYQGALNGYKMLTLPFQASIPTGVKAYTLSFSGSQINGTRIINNIIPANTPVLVNGSGSFNFVGGGNIVPLLNPRTDIATSVYIKVKVPVNSYYLTLANGTWSFTRATASVQPSVNSFDAYLSPASTASSLAIVLNDGAKVTKPRTAVSTASLNNLGYISSEGSSLVGSFIVSGTELSENVEIAAPANFEISLNAGSGYAASLSLAPAGDTLASTTIYVRMVLGKSVNTYNGTIAITSNGADSTSVTLSGTVSAQAVVNVSQTTITGLGYNTFQSIQPPVKSYLVSGGPLAGDITVTAPANFEVSNMATSGFGSTLALSMVNGKVDTTIIYVRLKGSLAESSYSGNIVVASSTATDKLIVLSGTVNSSRIYDFTTDAATTSATTPPAANITVATGNTATAGVVSYTDATLNTSNRFRAYTGGNRNQTGVMDLNLFPNNATDYAVTWKQSNGSVTDYKVGVLLRGSGLAGTNATTGYVQGIMNGYLFIVYNAGSSRTEFRIYRSTAATSLNTLVNTTVSSLVPTMGQSVWYRASTTGTSPVSLKLEYSTDSVIWRNGCIAADASAGTFTSGSTQLIWGLGSPGYNFFLDNISYKAFSKIQFTSTSDPTYDGQPHAASGFAYGTGGVSEKLNPELSFVYKDAVSNVLSGAPVTAGTYKVVASFSGNGAYMATKDSTTMTIVPRALTIKAKDQTKECGTTLDLGTTAFTADGMVENDVISSVSLSSTGAPLSGTVGSYPIVVSNAQGTGLTNYAITYENGTLLVQDVTKPVPVIAELPQITSECSVSITETPKASDGCAGYITATTTDPLVYNEQGTYTINWKYEDGHGNINEQTQKVIVKDVTIPVITNCPIVPVQCFSALGTYTIPQLTATDNCGSIKVSFSISGATTRRGDGTDASGSFNVGTSTIDWLVEDGNGNLATCQTNVTVNTPMSVHIPDVYALSSETDMKNTIYLGYGPSALTITAAGDGGVSPYAYTWNTGAVTQSISVNTAGAYNVNVSDVNKCSASASIVIVKVDVRCGNNDNKVKLCHNGEEICVAASAVNEHLDHGDHLNGCNVPYVSIRMREEAGFLEETIGNSIKMYPNPAKDKININLGMKAEQVRRIEVVDINGRLVSQRLVNGQSSLVVSMSDLSSGIYFVRVIADEVTTYKIVKQ